LNGGYDIYRASKMPDVAAGSGGDSWESSRKYPTFHDVAQW
jgi:hypothetical protein